MQTKILLNRNEFKSRKGLGNPSGLSYSQRVEAAGKWRKQGEKSSFQTDDTGYFFINSDS